MRLSTKISFVAIVGLLCATCSSIQNQPNYATSSWETERCDTNARVDDFTALDLALPFYANDTLKDKLKTVPRIFVVIIENQQLKSWTALTAASFKDRPTIWQPVNLPETLAVNKKDFQLIDNEYIWALTGRPDYPFDRYQLLLQATRDTFLTRRNAMMADYQREFPKYQLRVQSDLRGAGFQRQYLAAGKSVSPLGQHQFGLAADIGIHYKGGQLQSIERYKYLLDSIGRARYGLTWGGSFKGFVDPNHVQYFLNSSELLRRFPELRFEFEPFTAYFKKRVGRMTAAGKAAKVEDTKALLATLHQLHFNKPCHCDTLAERRVSAQNVLIQKSMQVAGYEAKNDLLLVGNLDEQTVVLFHATGAKRALRVGIWK